MRGRRKRRFHGIYTALDLPLEADLLTPVVTLTGDEAVAIENAGRALTCTQKFIRLETHLGVMRIGGENLKLMEFFEGRAVITGRIDLIAYERTDDGSCGISINGML